jgi:hypothetical protein
MESAVRKALSNRDRARGSLYSQSVSAIRICRYALFTSGARLFVSSKRCSSIWSARCRFEAA